MSTLKSTKENPVEAARKILELSQKLDEITQHSFSISLENAALREQINKKPVFEWCEDCELFRSCYVWDFKGESGQVIRGPNFISPSCSEEGN